MNTASPLVSKLVARRCWVQGRRVYLEIDDRRSVSFPATKYATLEHATQTELEKIHLSPAGTVITWDSIDERILVEDVGAGRFVHTPRNTPALPT